MRVAVVGAGAAGLLATAAAVRAGHEATLVERDRVADLPSGPAAAARPGVPQGSQPHVLLHRGLLAIERLLPGTRDALVAAGGVPLDTGTLAWLGPYGWSPFPHASYDIVSISRPAAEAVLRAQVLALPAVTLRDGGRAVGLDRGPGTGWTLRLDGGEELAADVVVDAAGRASRLPHWLEALGVPAPPTAQVDARLGYATRVYAAPPDALAPASGLVLLMTPEQPRGGLALPVEGGRWMVALVGIGDDRPPRDAAGFDAFARSLRDGALAAFTASARPLGPVAVHRQTGNVRHDLRGVRGIDGLVVVGDAACAFNPVYGQGITVAALQAEVLAGALHGGRPGPDLAGRLRRVTDLPWSVATGQDAQWVPAPPARTPLDRVFGAWVERVALLAVRGDGRAQHALDALYHLMAPPSVLLDPRLGLSALRAVVRPGVPAPRPPLPTA